MAHLFHSPSTFALFGARQVLKLVRALAVCQMVHGEAKYSRFAMAKLLCQVTRASVSHNGHVVVWHRLAAACPANSMEQVAFVKLPCIRIDSLPCPRSWLPNMTSFYVDLGAYSRKQSAASEADFDDSARHGFRC